MNITIVDINDQSQQFSGTNLIEELQRVCIDDYGMLKDITLDSPHYIPGKYLRDFPNLQNLLNLIVLIGDNDDLEAVVGLKYLTYIDMYFNGVTWHNQFWTTVSEKLQGHFGFSVQIQPDKRGYYVVNKEWLSVEYNSLDYIGVIYENYPYTLKLMVPNLIFSEDILNNYLQQQKTFLSYTKEVNDLRQELLPNLPKKVHYLAGFVQ